MVFNEVNREKGEMAEILVVHQKVLSMVQIY